MKRTGLGSAIGLVIAAVGCGSDPTPAASSASGASTSVSTASGGGATTTSSSPGSGGAGSTGTSGGMGGTSGGMGGAGDGGGVGGADGQGGATPIAFALTSPAFSEGMKVPAPNECTNCNAAGAMNDSPQLSWTPGPAGTMSYAIVMRDLDFQNGFVHWVLWDIPASTLALPADVDTGKNPPDVPGANQCQGNYLGPCSCNSTNTYQWTVHAIATPTIAGLAAGAAKATAAAEVEKASIASASLSGES